ncbi:imidazole glycerol phosphate synthase subunit HisH [Isoalcanivorax beigongshangi]|uniref:Imidazole glycerol phosphate synthase subunit HisH n=1 Tax=Isoalcanivorax beigongshangi TaxID=3238810 RepID=A0ABV4AKJ4_9GAMM
MAESVVLIDYGMGNLHSAAKALEQASPSHRVRVSSDAQVVAAADRVVFPGVGAMRDCMGALRERGLDQAILSVVAAGRPLLGICIGMQALTRHSAENGGVDCLAVLDGSVTRFPDHAGKQRLKVPHMGWSPVLQQPHPLWQGIADQSRFYFVHSYCAADLSATQTVGSCDYGVPFAAAAARDNVFAVQFHPEKSAADGLTLLANFLRWQP